MKICVTTLVVHVFHVKKNNNKSTEQMLKMALRYTFLQSYYKFVQTFDWKSCIKMYLTFKQSCNTYTQIFTLTSSE